MALRDVELKALFTGEGGPCEDRVKLTVIQADLDVDSDNNNGTGPPDRTTAEDLVETTGTGKQVCANTDDDDDNDMPDKDQEPPPATDNELVPMVLEIRPATSPGVWRLQYDASKVQVYENNRVAVVPPNTSFVLPITPNPKNFWVEGLASTMGGQTTVTVEVDPDGNGTFDCSDEVAITVLNSLKVPLGTSLANTEGLACYRVYMPTKWGGKLDVQTTAGTVTDLAFPDGSPYANNSETGEDKHGWYTFTVVGAESYTVSALFTQVGQATTRPWNFYWWSTNPPLLNLFETMGPYRPLVKYDARHGTAARDWEAANHSGPPDWCGHCLGGAIASITLLAQPTPVAGSAYNAEELEGLWAELGEQTGHLLGDGVSAIPAGPPIPGMDSTDEKAHEFHDTLERFVKSAGLALYAQLRSHGGAADEVWNHAVFKFMATFEEAPGDDEKVVKITNLVTANDDHTPPTDDMGTRDPEYVYIITYRMDGTAGPATANDWISVGGEASFAPAILRVVDTPLWAANNPHVIEANVRADDAGN